MGFGLFGYLCYKLGFRSDMSLVFMVWVSYFFLPRPRAQWCSKMLAFNVLLLGFTGTGHRGSRCLFLLLELVWTLIRHWFLLHLLRVSGSILTAGYFTFFISTLILRSFGESHLSLSSRLRYNTSSLFFLADVRSLKILGGVLSSGESAKAKWWKKGSLCYSVSSSTLSHWAHRC